MELNEIQSTGTWGQQATILNDNFNKVSVSIDLVKGLVSHNQKYATVASYSELPATGESDTIYRVAGTNSYSEYAWDGSEYIKLDDKDVGASFIVGNTTYNDY